MLRPLNVLMLALALGVGTTVVTRHAFQRGQRVVFFAGWKTLARSMRNSWVKRMQVVGEQHRRDRSPMTRVVRYDCGALLEQEDIREEVRDRLEGKGLLVNAHPGGLCLLLDWAPAVGHILRLHMPLPLPNVQIPTPGDVRLVRSLPFGRNGVCAVGLQFVL